MKEMYPYIGTTYTDSCQPDIMTKTPATFPYLDMPTIMTYTGAENPKTGIEMIYLKKRTSMRPSVRN